MPRLLLELKAIMGARCETAKSHMMADICGSEVSRLVFSVLSLTPFSPSKKLASFLLVKQLCVTLVVVALSFVMCPSRRPFGQVSKHCSNTFL